MTTLAGYYDRRHIKDRMDFYQRLLTFKPRSDLLDKKNLDIEQIQQNFFPEDEGEPMNTPPRLLPPEEPDSDDEKDQDPDPQSKDEYDKGYAHGYKAGQLRGKIPPMMPMRPRVHKGTMEQIFEKNKPRPIAPAHIKSKLVRKALAEQMAKPSPDFVPEEQRIPLKEKSRPPLAQRARARKAKRTLEKTKKILGEAPDFEAKVSGKLKKKSSTDKMKAIGASLAKLLPLDTKKLRKKLKKIDQ